MKHTRSSLKHIAPSWSLTCIVSDPIWKIPGLSFYQLSTHVYVYLHVCTYCQRFENNPLQEKQGGPGSAAKQSWALKGKMYHHKCHHSVLAGELPVTPVRTFTVPHQCWPYCRAWNTYHSLQRGLRHRLFLTITYLHWFLVPAATHVLIYLNTKVEIYFCLTG